MYVQKNIKINGADNRPFLLDLHLAHKEGDVIIFCHGFKGFKDWGAWSLVGDYFASQGVHFVKFNFSHNGTSIDNPCDFDDLEAFEQNTYSKELADLDAVFKWLSNEKSKGTIPYENVHIIGHSRSGPIAIIGGLNHKEVASVTTWAGVHNLDYAFRPDFLEEWKKNGVRYIYNGRTNQQMPLGYGVLQDYYANEERLNLFIASKNPINKPEFHFIHGEKDMAIPHEAMLQLKHIFPTAQTNLIPNTGHTFRTTHPWHKNELSESLKYVCEITLNGVKNS